MGYYTKVTDKIKFIPAIQYVDAQSNSLLSSFLPDSQEFNDLELVADEYDVDDNPIALAYIVCPETSPFKAYQIEENLIAIVTNLPGRKFEGRLELQGEDGDIYGYRVKDGNVEQIEPTLTWPED